MILIVDADFLFAQTIADNCRRAGAAKVKIIGDAITAMQFLEESGEVPSLIFLSVLLVGPDAFTFLNELRSYTETAAVPVVLIHNLRYLEQFSTADFGEYGVVAVLAKTQMTPTEIQTLVQQYAALPAASVREVK